MMAIYIRIGYIFGFTDNEASCKVLLEVTKRRRAPMSSHALSSIRLVHASRNIRHGHTGAYLGYTVV
jgi:hypothetical protein